MKPFKILSTETVYDSPWVHVQKERVLLPNGEESDWYITGKASAIIIIPILENGDILLQKIYKHGCREVVTEFCAGMIDKGETPEQSAQRELMEETGHTAKKITKLGELYTNPTGSQMKYYFFLAEGCECTGEVCPETSEQIELFPVSEEEANKILHDSKTKTSAGILAAWSYFQNFKKM